KLDPPRRLIVTEPVLGAECRLLETVGLVDQEGFLTLEVFGSAPVMITLIDTRQTKAMTVGRLPMGGCGRPMINIIIGPAAVKNTDIRLVFQQVTIRPSQGLQLEARADQGDHGVALPFLLPE